jgi:acetate---CoA ligase (ADP-forming)
MTLPIRTSAIIRFAAAHADSLEEPDVNPLLVLPKRAVAVDVLINLLRASAFA